MTSPTATISERMPLTGLGEVSPQNLRGFADRVVEPTDNEWHNAFRRLVIIGQEEPVINLNRQLAEAGEEGARILLHQLHVTIVSDVMGQRDGLSSHELAQLSRTAQVHDIGKADHEVMAWISSDEEYRKTGRYPEFLAVVAKHSRLGVEMIQAEDTPFVDTYTVEGVETFIGGWNDVTKEESSVLVWGHHDFKGNQEQCYGEQPPESDPLYPAARILSLGDMSTSMGEGKELRPYKDASSREGIRRKLHKEAAVSNTTIDFLLSGTRLAWQHVREQRFAALRGKGTPVPAAA